VPPILSVAPGRKAPRLHRKPLATNFSTNCTNFLSSKIRNPQSAIACFPASSFRPCGGMAVSAMISRAGHLPAWCPCHLLPCAVRRAVTSVSRARRRAFWPSQAERLIRVQALISAETSESSGHQRGNCPVPGCILTGPMTLPCQVRFIFRHLPLFLRAGSLHGLTKPFCEKPSHFLSNSPFRPAPELFGPRSRLNASPARNDSLVNLLCLSGRLVRSPTFFF